MAALQQETADVLARLIRFKTVNPPGHERECQEWLAGYLREAGLDVELLGADPERPNLVATLEGDEPGPVLGYLSHVDTVLADPDDWTHDPWSGEVHDGHLWGRGALDMKSQTAAEAVAAATLAREGWRPSRGALKVIAVVDEETGGRLGAQWLTEEHPDIARVDWLVNEGGGSVMPYGDRRIYPACARREGHLPLQGHRARRGRPRLDPRHRRQRAAQARARAGPARRAPARLRRHRRAARAARGARRGPRRPAGGDRPHQRRSSRSWPPWSSRPCA